MLNNQKNTHPTFATTTANALYNLTRYKNGKLSRNDYQPLYFRVDEVYTACKSFNNSLEDSKATAEKIATAKNFVYIKLAETLKEIGKVNGFSVTSKRLEGKEDTSIFYSAMRALITYRSADISTEASAKRLSLKTIKTEMRKALSDKNYKEYERLTELAKTTAKELKTLEKQADNCTKKRYYNSEKAFAKVFIFDLAQLVAEQATLTPEAIASERKARNKATADARKDKGKDKANTEKQQTSKNAEKQSKGKQPKSNGKQATKDAKATNKASK